jgi:NADPH:quinone reductase-like Zn-dependent oxidoreductase
MRSLLSATNPPYAELGQVDEPRPSGGQALIEVRAFSLNRGETRRLASMPEASVTGWDRAVSAPAPDGSRPAAGARVVGVVGASEWAERAAVPTEHLAELSDDAIAALLDRRVTGKAVLTVD